MSKYLKFVKTEIIISQSIFFSRCKPYYEHERFCGIFCRKVGLGSSKLMPFPHLLLLSQLGNNGLLVLGPPVAGQKPPVV